jgi:squalene cyclase
MALWPPTKSGNVEDTPPPKEKNMKDGLSQRETGLLLPPAIASLAADIRSKALRYVTAMQEENGGWSRLTGEFPAESEPTSWVVRVFSTAGVESQRIAQGIDFILRDQKPDGSWSGNSAHTAFVILALVAAGKGDGAIGKGIEYLRGVQDKEGGFRRLGTEGVPLAAFTANVLNGLAAAGCAEDDPMVVKALSWLASCQNNDGGYGMSKGSDSVALSTAWTIKALRGFGAEPTNPAVRNGRTWLLGTQKASGGFSNTRAAPEDPEITSLAIIALKTLTDEQQAIEKAVAYLAAAQHPDGSFTGNTPMQFKGESKKNTQTTVFVAWALG